MEENYFSISCAYTHDLKFDLITDWSSDDAKAALEHCEQEGNSNFNVTEWEPATDEWAEEPVMTMNLDEFRCTRGI